MTKHELILDPVRVDSSYLLLRRFLDFPDGVSVSDDNEWIAISNHDAHVVLVYRWKPSLAEQSDPDAVLRGTIYPHGLRFTPDGCHLIVADAGRPYVNVYERHGEAWDGVRFPERSSRSSATRSTRSAAIDESRGPKGISIDSSGRVLTVTFEKRPIAFFDLALVLGASAESVRTNDLRYELEAFEDAGTRLDEAATKLMGSRSFRLTKPFRTLNAAVEVIAALTTIAAAGTRGAVPYVRTADEGAGALAEITAVRSAGRPLLDGSVGGDGRACSR